MNGVREGYAHVTGAVVHQAADGVWAIFGKRLERSVFAGSPGGKDMPGADEALMWGRLSAFGRLAGHRISDFFAMAKVGSPNGKRTLISSLKRLAAKRLPR